MLPEQVIREMSAIDERPVDCFMPTYSRKHRARQEYVLAHYDAKRKAISSHYLRATLGRSNRQEPHNNLEHLAKRK